MYNENGWLCLQNSELDNIFFLRIAALPVIIIYYLPIYRYIPACLPIRLGEHEETLINYPCSVRYALASAPFSVPYSRIPVQFRKGICCCHYGRTWSALRSSNVSANASHVSTYLKTSVSHGNSWCHHQLFVTELLPRPAKPSRFTHANH